MDNQTLCLKLANCETETEVTTLLKQYNYWDNDSYWQNFGGIEEIPVFWSDRFEIFA